METTLAQERMLRSLISKGPKELFDYTVALYGR
jgi:hypothetical protein